MRPMSEHGNKNPMRAAQAAMRPEPIRRFYKTVGVREAEGGHALTLDGRIARTPRKNRLVAKNRAMMQRAAEEWARQGPALDPADMPLTRLLNAAIDGVALTMEETRGEIVRYAGSDLVCYRAEAPETLAERQRLAFDPALEWAEEALGARFNRAAGVVHVAQPLEALAAVRAAVEAFGDPPALAALSAVTTLTGSALLALAVAHGRLDAAEAWRAAHVDEDFEIERWGVDEEAMARREARWREMEAAAEALRLLRMEDD
jgi:chaperone required for assembly of F1-ATPase